MKKFSLILLIILIVFSASCNNESAVKITDNGCNLPSISTWDTVFYYNDVNKKTVLIPIGDELFIKLENNTSINNESDFINSFNLDLELINVKKIIKDIYQINGTISSNLSIRNALINNINIKSIYPNYKTSGDIGTGTMGVTDEIIYRPLETTTDEKILAINEKYAATVIEKTENYQVVVIPKCKNMFEFANAYYEEGLFLYACPSFYITVTLDKDIK